MTTAKKTDPDLWEAVKEELVAGDRGGEPGQWSARKAQLAVLAYKRRGGRYESDGPAQPDTDLNEWTEQDWGTRSGRDSAQSGERYLPRHVRMLLTADEYRRSTAKKQADSHEGDEQFSSQPKDVREKVAAIKSSGPSRAMLVERARDLEVRGFSDMNEDELLKAIDAVTDGNGRRSDSGDLERLKKDELYRRAKAAEIDGRSKMNKAELADALRTVD